jgi:hypothetical protein
MGFQRVCVCVCVCVCVGGMTVSDTLRTTRALKVPVCVGLCHRLTI